MNENVVVGPYIPVPPSDEGRTGFATTALVLGIIGVVMAFIPVIGMIAFVLCPLAIIFGVLGRKSSKSGQATAGLATGIVGLAISILWAILFTATVGAASTQVDHLDKQWTAYNNCMKTASTPNMMSGCDIYLNN